MKNLTAKSRSREEKWTVPTEDGHIIYGVTNFAAENTDRCVVIVHGLTGHMNEYLHKRAALYFSSKKYDVHRFNLYGEEDARRLRDCTLEIHASDLKKVIAEKCVDYAGVFLVGHSYGGPSVMVSQPEQATALSLWDPSFDLPRVWCEEGMRTENSLRFFDCGTDILCPEEMSREAEKYDVKKCLSLSEQLKKPTQVIHADEGMYVKDQYSYHSVGHEMSERRLVKGADHCFNDGDVCDTLLEYAYEYFERF